MKAEIIKRLDDGSLVVRLHDQLDEQVLKDNLYNGRSFIYIDPWLKDRLTDQQRKHFYSIVKDIADYTGEPPWKIKLNMKYLYMITNEVTKEPSLAHNKMSRADGSKLIQTMLDYCLDNDIPLQNNYQDEMTAKHFYALTMKRLCWVCGKGQSDIAHYEEVGMGRNRNKIDHTKHKFMCLCREHHTEQHAIGTETFIDKYKLEPIKLSLDSLKQLGVM